MATDYSCGDDDDDSVEQFPWFVSFTSSLLLHGQSILVTFWLVMGDHLQQLL